jgi:hypothetical protein
MEFLFVLILGTGLSSILLFGIALLIHIPLTATAIKIIVGIGFFLGLLPAFGTFSSNEPSYSNKRRLTQAEIERIEDEEREDKIRSFKGYYRCVSEELPSRYGVDGGFYLLPWIPSHVFVYHFGVNKFIDRDEHLYLGVESIESKEAFGREKDEIGQIIGKSASVFLVYGTHNNIGFVMHVFRIKEGWSFKLENENPDTDRKIYPSLYKAKMAGLNFKENLFS